MGKEELDKMLYTKLGLGMTCKEWLTYFDSLTLNEVSILYWEEFECETRRFIHEYLKKRIIKKL